MPRAHRTGRCASAAGRQPPGSLPGDPPRERDGDRPPCLGRGALPRRGPVLPPALLLPLALSLGLGASAGCERTPARRTSPPPTDAGVAGDPGSSTPAGTGRVGEGVGTPELAELGEPESPRVRPTPPAVRGRDAGIAAVRSGALEAGRDALRAHLQRTPKDDEARLELARALAHLGDVDGAIAELRQLPRDGFATAMHARLLADKGELDAADKLLNARLQASPDDLVLVGAALELALLRGRAREPAARAWFDQLYDAFDAGTVKTAAQLRAVAIAALSQATRGSFHDANSVLADAETAAPPAAGAWVGDDVALLRAAIFREKYAAEAALETYALVLERDPWHPGALAGTAWVYLEALQFPAAIRVAQELLQVDPGHPDAHAALAWIAAVEGRRTQAAQQAEAALQRAPAHDAALAVLSAMAVARRDTQDAARWRERALARHPAAPRFHALQAELLGFMHLYPEVDALLATAVQLDERDPYLASAYGTNLLRLGDEVRGRELLQRAWKRDPFNERTRNVLDLYAQTIDPSHVRRGSVSVPTSARSPRDVTMVLPTADAEWIEPELRRAVTRATTALDQAYGRPSGALQLEFFREPDAFGIRTVGVPSLGALAVCFGQTITFIGPYEGAFNMDQVVWHELSHTYAIALSAGRVPRWFTEGLSEWESELADPSWARESAALLAEAARRGRLRKLSELELAFIRAGSPAMMEVAYATATYAVRYLGETYGRPKLIAMLEAWGRGLATEAVFETVLGQPLSAVEAEFERWFAAELARKQSGWSPRAITVEVHQADPSRAPRSQPAGDRRDALFAAAVAAIERRDHAAAEAALAELVAGDGDGYAPRLLLAQLAVDRGAPRAEIEGHVRKALAFAPEALEPRVLWAETLRRAGAVADELAALEAALAVDAQSLDPAVRQLTLGVLAGDPQARDRGLARARAIAPLHPAVLAGRAELAAAARPSRRDEAAALARRALADATPEAIERGPADTWAVVALVAARVGDRTQAAAIAATLLARPSLEPVVREALSKSGLAPPG